MPKPISSRVAERIKCRLCLQVKARDEFHARYQNGIEYRVTMCKLCVARDKRIQYFSDPTYKEKQKAYSRAQKARCPNAHREQDRLSPYLKGTYGLTIDQLYAREESQDFCCAICGRDDQRLVVDHHHESLKVRALLCDGCNMGLGSFREDPNILAKAISYLSR